MKIYILMYSYKKGCNSCILDIFRVDLSALELSISVVFQAQLYNYTTSGSLFLFAEDFEEKPQAAN